MIYHFQVRFSVAAHKKEARDISHASGRWLPISGVPQQNPRESIDNLRAPRFRRESDAV